MIKTKQRLRVALFDYQVTATNPIGQCNLKLIEGLQDEIEFTVFALDFDNPCPEQVAWVRIPAPRRPMALLYVVFHLLAPIYFLAHRLRERQRFDVVQYGESNIVFGNIAYSHFSHRTYLKEHDRNNRGSGLRGRLLWLDHWLHSIVEPFAYGRAESIIAPSRGLANELLSEFPSVDPNKIVRIPNPVDVAAFKPQTGFDSNALRKELGLAPHDLVLVFLALGHFERKGLPLLLQALAEAKVASLKLIVVGGHPGVIATYMGMAHSLHIAERVVFVGMQRDVKPYLWSADAFTLPSAYEVFPLVALEAAAAGLPLIVTPLHGVEELLRDNQNGILTERSVEGITAGLKRFAALPADQRRAMGNEARIDVEKYNSDHFLDAWRRFYSKATVEPRR